MYFVLLCMYFFLFFFSVFFLFWLTGCFVLSFYFLIFLFFFFIFFLFIFFFYFFFFLVIYFLVFAGLLLQTRFRNGSRFSSSARLGWYSLRDASSPLLLLLLPCGSTSWLHDYAFASLGPGIVLLVGRVYQWVSLLVLFHVLPHPANKQTVWSIIFSFNSNVWINFFLSFLLINMRIDREDWFLLVESFCEKESLNDSDDEF